MSANKAFAVLLASFCVVSTLVTEVHNYEYGDIVDYAENYLKELVDRLKYIEKETKITIDNLIDIAAGEIATNRRYMPKTLSAFKDEISEKYRDSFLGSITGSLGRDREQGLPSLAQEDGFGDLTSDDLSANRWTPRRSTATSKHEESNKQADLSAKHGGGGADDKEKLRLHSLLT